MSSSNSYTIHPFHDAASFEISLEKAFSHPNGRINQNPADKQHFKYLANYLYKDENGLKVQTILVEHNYISLSYLSDYVNYYAQCYHPYTKECVRVHFFFDKIDEKTFEEMVTENKHTTKWNRYAGNVVIKPLPRGYIGATLLRPYADKQGRHYTAIKTYPVNLFGRSNSVTTLKYQEQDGVVGSCASSALWFAFQKTNELFGTSEPSPSEITISAGLDYLNSGRSFPSTELEIEQIGKAIYANGLVSEIQDDHEFLTDNRWMRAFVYAYLKMGIPVLVGISIDEKGQHLIALNGYRFDEDITNDKTERGNDKSGFNIKLKSDDIAKFYVHDDQIGPFAKLEFIKELELNDQGMRKQFQTSWWRNLDEEETLKATSLFAIVPIQDSIRVSFRNIFDQAIVLNFVMNKYMALEGVDYEWDIFLQKSNDYKEELRLQLLGNRSRKRREFHSILFQSLPLYVWVIQAYTTVDDTKAVLFDFIYDAGDVNYKNNPFCTNIYNDSIYDGLEENGLIKIFNYKHDPGSKNYVDIFRILSEEESVLRSIQNLENEMKNKDHLDQIRNEEYLDLLNKDEEIKTQFDEKIQASLDFVANTAEDGLASELPTGEDPVN